MKKIIILIIISISIFIYNNGKIVSKTQLVEKSKQFDNYYRNSYLVCVNDRLELK